MDATQLLGIILTLVAALGAAAGSLCIRMGTESGEVKDAVFITALVNMVVLFPLIVAVYHPEYGITLTSTLAFATTGLTGTILVRIMRYMSIMKIGASRTEPIVAAWVIVATLLGVVLLDETLVAVHGAGILLIVGGVALVARETSRDNPHDLSRRELLAGLLIPISAAVVLGWEPIFANFGFAEGTPAPVGLLIKSVTAVLGLTIYLRWREALPTRTAIRAASSRWFFLAGVTSTFSMLSYYVALNLAPVNIVAPIFVTNILLIALLSALFMPNRLENVTWKLVAAAAVVVCGVGIVSVFG